MSAEVKQLAAQLESMLLARMLRDMREAGRWDDDSGEGGLGNATFMETLDQELAGYLVQAQGLGLAQQLETALQQTATPGKATPADQTQAAAASTAAAPTAAAPMEALRYAVPDASITSNFGWRRDPFTGAARFHKGIDVRAAYGDEIQAAGAGRVVFSGEQGGYGTTVVVEHAGGVRTRYAHLSHAAVGVGDELAAGQVLGRAGHSGRATGTHLHFEVMVNGRHVAPADYGLLPPGRSGSGD